MIAEPEQEVMSSDPEEEISVERWDEIARELDTITQALSSIDGQLSTIHQLLATR